MIFFICDSFKTPASFKLDYARKKTTMSTEVAVSLPLENGSYNPRPPHSPAISTAKDHNQVSNNHVSSQTNCWITLSALHSFSKSAASILGFLMWNHFSIFLFGISGDSDCISRHCVKKATSWSK